MKKGLNKIPKVYTKTCFKTQKNYKVRTKRKVIFIKNKLSMKIVLNLFSKKQNYEFDVITCDGFCEKPGKWLELF